MIFLQKLQFYEETLNLRGAMAPWLPYFFHLWIKQYYDILHYYYNTIQYDLNKRSILQSAIYYGIIIVTYLVFVVLMM